LLFVAASCFSCQKIHIIEGRMHEGEPAAENATTPPLINEGSQRDRRRHRRDPLDDVTLSTFPLRSLAFFFSHFLFSSSSSFKKNKDAIYPNVCSMLRTNAPAGWLVSKTRWQTVRTRGSETLLLISFLSNIAQAILEHSVNQQNKRERERNRERKILRN